MRRAAVLAGIAVAGASLLLAWRFAWRGGEQPTFEAGTDSGSRATGTAASRSPPEAEFHFRDVAAACGLDRVLRSGSPEKLWILENIGTGCAFLDGDGDGRLDVYVANAGLVEGRKLVAGPGAAYYRQLPDGRFADETEGAGLADHGWSTGVAVGDADNDGDPDLFVGGYGRDLFYRNRGGVFAEAASAAGLASGERLSFTSSATFLDFDGDGFLDLFIARYVLFDLENPPNGGAPCLQGGIPIACGPGFHAPQAARLYRNLGGERFVDVSREAGIDRAQGSYGLGTAAGDLDGDGRPDIYVANDTTANFLWRNQGEGRFVDTALHAGCALSEEGQGQAGMGVDLGDADGDGDLDIVVTNYSEEPNAYYRNLGNCLFEEAGGASGIAAGSYLMLGWGVKLLDLDNDGDLDLVAANGHVHPRAAETNPALAYHQRCLFYANTGDGRFREVGEACGEAARTARAHRGLAAGDADNDGDLDILLTVLDGPPVLLRNESPRAARNGWLTLRLEGKRSNRDALGARVVVRSGNREQFREVTRGGSYLSAHDVRLHFGLGAEDAVENVHVRWPGGLEEDLGPLAGRASYRVVEGSARAVRDGGL